MDKRGEKMKKEEAMKRIILSFLVLLILFTLGRDSLGELKVYERLYIASPKNLAVFHTLVMLTSAGQRLRDRYFHSLAKEALKYFGEHKDHMAVKNAETLVNMMWFFPFNALSFRLSDFPEANWIFELPPESREYKAFLKIIPDFLESVRDFYRETGFEKFWQAHQGDIQSLLKEVGDSLSQTSIPQQAVKFYGKDVECFFFVPAPFMPDMAYNDTVVDKEGKRRFFHIQGALPNGFADGFVNSYFAFHEFSHGFIEPIAKNYTSEINKLDGLYKPLQEKFRKLGYGNWYRTFMEHIVTAGQLHLTRIAFGQEKAEKMLQREKRRGFMIIENFYALLVEYNENRAVYADLSDYFPEMLKKLSLLRVVEYRRSDIMGFYPEYKEDRLFVRSLVAGAAFEKAGIKEGDILFSIGEIEIHSEDEFNKSKQKWNNVKEGSSVKIVVVRENKKIELFVPVPFVTDYKYVKKKSV